MMQEHIRFDIGLPLNIGCPLKRIKSKSFYNHNYYKLPTYGDYVSYGRDNNSILFVVCHEDENCYSYAIGRFDDGGFVEAIEWTITQDILENITTVDIEEDAT